MRIQIQKRRKAGLPSSAALRGKLALMLGAVNEAQAELSVIFVGDQEMAELNGQWRRKNYPTDVLSFPQREPGFPSVAPSMLGDVVISVDTALRQGQAAGHGLEREVDILLAHGVAHLLGYDHELGPKEARAMKRMEKKLLAAIGGG